MIRHGESRWNLGNRFTGWVDVPLSINGVKEAQACAKHCRQYDFSRAFTSVLERAHSTLHIILSEQGRTGIVQHPEDSRYGRWLKASNAYNDQDIPIFQSHNLNERYYGLLQGLEKDAAERKYGADKVFAWRRGYEPRPPGGGESLKDVVKRTMPHVQAKIMPYLRRGETVVLVAHGNTLRALIKNFENISNENIAFINLPEAHPIAYSYRRGVFKRIEGEYTFDRPLR